MNEVTYSAVKSITISPKTSIEIYPNPVIAGQNFTIDVADYFDTNGYQMQLVDMNGKVVFENNHIQDSYYNMPIPQYLHSGIYVVRILDLQYNTHFQNRIIVY